MKRAQRVINNQFEGIKNVPHCRALNGLIEYTGKEGINGTDSINLTTSLHIINYSYFNKFSMQSADDDAATERERQKTVQRTMREKK